MNTIGQSSSIVCNYFLRDVELICAVGDVLHINLDAICVSCDSNYSLNAGVGQLVRRAGGDAFAHNLSATPRNGSVVAVPSAGCGRLRTSFVILVPLRRAHRYCLDLVYASIFECAKANDIQSMAIPALGTGLFGVSSHEASTFMKTALLSVQSFAPIQRIHFIDLNLTSLEAFRDVISNIIDLTSPARNANATAIASSDLDDDAMDQDEGPSTSAAALATTRLTTPLSSRLAAGQPVAGPSNTGQQLADTGVTPQPPLLQRPPSQPLFQPQTLAAGLCALMDDGPLTSHSQVDSFFANLPAGSAAVDGLAVSSADLPPASPLSSTGTASVPEQDDEDATPTPPKQAKRRGVNAPLRRWTSTPPSPPVRQILPAPVAGAPMGRTPFAQWSNRFNNNPSYNNRWFNNNYRRSNYYYYQNNNNYGYRSHFYKNNNNYGYRSHFYKNNYGYGDHYPRRWTYGGGGSRDGGRWLSPSPSPSASHNSRQPAASSRQHNGSPPTRRSASPAIRPKYLLRLNSTRRRHLYRNSSRAASPLPLASSFSSSLSSSTSLAVTAKNNDEEEDERMTVASAGRSSSSSDSSASIRSPYAYSDSSMSSFIDDDEDTELSDATYKPSQLQRSRHDEDDEDDDNDNENNGAESGGNEDGGGGSDSRNDEENENDDDDDGRYDPASRANHANGSELEDGDDESDDMVGPNFSSPSGAGSYRQAGGYDDDEDDDDDQNGGGIIVLHDDMDDTLQITMHGYADAFMLDDETDYAMAATFLQHNWMGQAMPAWLGGDDDSDLTNLEDEDDDLIAMHANQVNAQLAAANSSLAEDDDGISDSDIAAAVVAASATAAAPLPQSEPEQGSHRVITADTGGSLYDNGAWSSVSASELRTIRAAYLADEQRKTVSAANVESQEETAMPCAICLNELLEADVVTPARSHRRPSTDRADDEEAVPDQNSVGVVRLNVCKHMFHNKCIKEAFKVKRRCPLCMCWCAPAEGNQPLGARMQSRVVSGRVPGYDDADGYHEIRYTIPSGIQTAQHPRPGLPFYGTTRIAYLPNNAEGTITLRLLKLAFERRLVFSIGDSMTTGRRNVVVWNDIHHKTNKQGGVENYGYPDPDYLTRVQGELANIGIHKELLTNNNNRS